MEIDQPRRVGPPEPRAVVRTAGGGRDLRPAARSLSPLAETPAVAGALASLQLASDRDGSTSLRALMTCHGARRAGPRRRLSRSVIELLSSSPDGPREAPCRPAPSSSAGTGAGAPADGSCGRSRCRLPGSWDRLGPRFATDMGGDRRTSRVRCRCRAGRPPTACAAGGSTGQKRGFALTVWLCPLQSGYGYRRPEPLRCSTRLGPASHRVTVLALGASHYFAPLELS